MAGTMKIGRNIRTIRMLKNLTQEHVALKSGISVKWLGKIENELEEPSDEHLKAIAKSLDISEEELNYFHERPIFNNCNNSVNSAYNHIVNFQSTEKIEELYKQMIQEKDKIIKELQEQIKNQDKTISDLQHQLNKTIKSPIK